MEAERYADACSKFDESQQLDPSAGTLLNLGRCLELQGKSASAWAAYKETLVVGKATNKSRQVAAAELYLADLEPRLARLEIVVPHPVEGLRVRAGDVEFGHATRGLPVALDPGRYLVTADAPGYEKWTAELSLAEGETERLEVPVLEAAPVAPPPPPPPPPPNSGMSPFVIAGIATATVGVAGLGVGTAFGVMTLRDRDELESDPALCPGRRCTHRGLAELDSVETKATVSTATLVVGGLAAAAGGTLLTLGLVGVEPSPSPSAPTVSLLLGDTIGIVAIGTW